MNMEKPTQSRARRAGRLTARPKQVSDDKVKEIRDMIADSPALHVPVSDAKAYVTIDPGIQISEKNIRLAAEIGASPTDPLREKIDTHYASLRQDIDASRDFVKGMFEQRAVAQDLAQEDPCEKYVSLDKMPAALRRVITAYASAVDAQKELERAVAALDMSSLKNTSSTESV